MKLPYARVAETPKKLPDRILPNQLTAWLWGRSEKAVLSARMKKERLRPMKVGMRSWDTLRVPALQEKSLSWDGAWREDSRASGKTKMKKCSSHAQNS